MPPARRRRGELIFATTQRHGPSRVLRNSNLLASSESQCYRGLNLFERALCPAASFISVGGIIIGAVLEMGRAKLRVAWRGPRASRLV